jgi:hypothetical protein
VQWGESPEKLKGTGGKPRGKKLWLLPTGRRGKVLFPKDTIEKKVYLLTE